MNSDRTDLRNEAGVTAAIDVVRQAFAALEAGDMATAAAFAPTLRLADAWAAGPELVLAHLVRRAGADAGPLESDRGPERRREWRRSSTPRTHT